MLERAQIVFDCIAYIALAAAPTFSPFCVPMRTKRVDGGGEMRIYSMASPSKQSSACSTDIDDEWTRVVWERYRR